MSSFHNKILKNFTQCSHIFHLIICFVRKFKKKKTFLQTCGPNEVIWGKRSDILNHYSRLWLFCFRHHCLHNGGKNGEKISQADNSKTQAKEVASSPNRKQYCFSIFQ